MSPSVSDAGDPDPTGVWWYEKVPCGRSRKQGLIQKKTFSRDLETFVREILQNSTDARANDERPVSVSFELRSFDDKSEFEEAIQWDELYDHIDAAGRAQDGHGLTDYLEYLEDGGEFRVLTIEEENAKGIQGNEEDQDSDYAALVRDPGASNKGGSTGGRHGLGSTLLWVASGFQTVLFNSTLADELPGQTSPRLVGRSFVPTHELADGECYDNDGWFGSPTGLEREELKRPESIWGDAASSLAENLGMSRPDANGTTIVVLGFRDPSDPTMDEQPTPEELADVFETATIEYFWPAICRGDLEVEVDMCGHGGEVTEETVRDYDVVAPFVECYDGMWDAPESFRGPGTVARVEYPYEITSRKDTDTPTDGKATVAARKAEPSDTEGEASKRLGQIAMFRGPGMVVDYKPGHYLGHSGKYHAVLAAGKGRTPPGESHSEEDEAVDDFLAMAEPPMHDKWYGEKNDELKAEYESGCVGAADALSTRVLRNALSKILYSQSRTGGTRIRPGRDILPRTQSGWSTLDDDDTPPRPKIPPLFDWSISDRFDGDDWVFTGSLEPNRDRRGVSDGVEGWDTTFELVAVFEDGVEADEVLITDIDVTSTNGDGGDLEWEMIDGGKRGRIRATGNVTGASFEIRSELGDTNAKLGSVTRTRFKITDGSVEVSE